MTPTSLPDIVDIMSALRILHCGKVYNKKIIHITINSVIKETVNLK